MQRMNSPFTLVFLIALVISLAVVSSLLKGPAGEAEEPNVAEEISPSVVFALGPLEVTSTVISTWTMMLLLGAGAYVAGHNLKLRPGPVQNLLEWIVEGIENLIRQMVGVEDSTIFLPFVGTLAFFIGSANLIGLIPHTGHQHTAGPRAFGLFQRALFRSSHVRRVALSQALRRTDLYHAAYRNRERNRAHFLAHLSSVRQYPGRGNYHQHPVHRDAALCPGADDVVQHLYRLAASIRFRASNLCIYRRSGQSTQIEHIQNKEKSSGLE
jgi:hypothetical protein